MQGCGQGNGKANGPVVQNVSKKTKKQNRLTLFTHVLTLEK